MFRLKTLISGCILATACAAAVAATPSQIPDFWSTPTIAGYGRIHIPDGAAYKPDASQTYKIVFSVTQGSSKPSEVNGALDQVARAVNLYVAAGVPLKNLSFVAIVSGAATPLALDDAHYRAKFGVANPNLRLIGELRQAGVDVAVCGQAAAEHDFDYQWIDRNVTLALSGLTTVSVLEQRGYALLPL